MNIDRIEIIRERISKEGKVTLESLAEQFPNVSSMTLRRDLTYLENRGEVIRVRGGAVSVSEVSKVTEAGFHSRSLMHAEQKKQISEKALQFIEPNVSVFIDSGSTMLAFVKRLPDLYYNVVTNGLSVALELCRRNMPNVTLLGGSVSHMNLSTSGGFSSEMLSRVNIETAFVAATAFSEEAGFTCGSPTENELKRFVMQSARRKILLMDSSKVGRVMPYTFAKASEADLLISDDEFPKDLAARLEKLGVKVI